MMASRRSVPLWLAASLIFLATGGCSATSAHHPLPPGGFAEYLAGRSILFVGSHPDDEWGVAPMFAEACLHNGARCHFIVAADARSLGCKLSIGMDDRDRCTRLRREEMRASAAHFRAEVTFFGWEDLFYAFDRGGVERTLAEWSRAAGGQASLVEQLRAEILRVGPDVIFSLDPRHGTTCHPNHRALSLLLIDVLETLEPHARPDVWFETDFVVEDRMSPAMKAAFAEGAVFRWPGDPAPVQWFDASKRLPGGERAWDHLVHVLKTHRTQYPDIAAGRQVLAPPARLQRIPFVRLQDIDPRVELCSPLGLDLPTEDRKPGPALP